VKVERSSTVPSTHGPASLSRFKSQSRRRAKASEAYYSKLQLGTDAESAAPGRPGAAAAPQVYIFGRLGVTVTAMLSPAGRRRIMAGMSGSPRDPGPVTAVTRTHWLARPVPPSDPSPSRPAHHDESVISGSARRRAESD
jgi:hypothetical protein